MTETRLGFKEMCARFDVTPRTLRYYEYIELLAPVRRARHGQRAERVAFQQCAGFDAQVQRRLNS